MDLSKSREFFDPEKDRSRVHILGCGSVGSAVAENLVRCGVTNLTLWDFDVVEPHNVGNQMFRAEDVGKPKTEALRDILLDINPDLRRTIRLENKGWDGQTLSGYLFLMTDSVENWKRVLAAHRASTYLKAVFNTRTGLTGGQLFSADWSDMAQRKSLLASMDFTDEEAKAETPVTACGTTLGVVTTVRIVSALAVNNFIRFVKGESFWKTLIFDGFHGEMEAYE